MPDTKNYIYNSRGVINSEFIDHSFKVNDSRYVDSSAYVENSHSVSNSHSVRNSYIVTNSHYIDNSCRVKNSSCIDQSASVHNSYKVIFCHDIGFKEYAAFNKEVGKNRFTNIRHEITSILSVNKPLGKITKKQWQKLAQIPEFDRNVVEKIVNYTVPLNEDEPIEDVQEMTVEDVSKLVGKTVKIVE